jgi:hypothetical protein
MDLAVECCSLTKEFPRSCLPNTPGCGLRGGEYCGRAWSGCDGLFYPASQIRSGVAQGIGNAFDTRVGLAVPLNMELALKLTDEIGKMLRSLIRSLQDGRNDRTY